MKIWKYELPLIFGHYEIEMPKRAEILTVQLQHDRPCIWALVKPENEKEKRTFFIAGTGEYDVESYDEYVGTFQILAGDIVYHVFERHR